MKSGFRISTYGRHSVSVVCLLLLMIATANAYTIVMRGGRRLEIPSNFTVTPSTLTYEVSGGIQVTLQIAAIDIPATEKANNEPSGSFLRRVQNQPLDSDKTTVGPISRRTITNRDLEPFIRRRRESDLAYEQRRKELGLPSIEESRRKASEQEQILWQELEQRRMAESNSEAYWRTRASALRTELAAIEAELDYVRLRLEDVQYPLATSSVAIVSSVLPFGSFGGFGGFGHSRFNPRLSPAFVPRRGVYVAPGTRAAFRGRIGFGGGGSRGHVFINPRRFSHPTTTGLGAPFLGLPAAAFLASTLSSYDFSYERSELITRFNELAAIRAGLKARWRELEEEARRAGVPPGWLRP